MPAKAANPTANLTIARRALAEAAAALGAAENALDAASAELPAGAANGLRLVRSRAASVRSALETGVIQVFDSAIFAECAKPVEKRTTLAQVERKPVSMDGLFS